LLKRGAEKKGLRKKEERYVALLQINQQNE